MATVLNFSTAMEEWEISYDPQVVSANFFAKVFCAAKMAGAFTATIKKPGEITITGYSGDKTASRLLNEVETIAGHN